VKLEPQEKKVQLVKLERRVVKVLLVIQALKVQQELRQAQ
jgi:hypothetical protein